MNELRRRHAHNEADPDTRQKAWDDALGVAIGKKAKVGMAAHIYKRRFGVFPRDPIQGLPSGKEWKLSALDFYRNCVRPNKMGHQREMAGQER